MCIYTYICIYIYIYIHTYIHPYKDLLNLEGAPAGGRRGARGSKKQDTSSSAANLRTKIMDVRGFDSSRFVISRGGIPRPTGNFPESLSRAILAGRFLVGRLGVIYIYIYVYVHIQHADSEAVASPSPSPPASNLNVPLKAPRPKGLSCRGWTIYCTRIYVDLMC